MGSNYPPRKTRIGKITYIGWYYGGVWRVSPFRPPHSRKGVYSSRTPVRGGRWRVRRVPEGDPNSPWVAFTDGVAKKWRRRWASQQQAFRWGHLVATIYRDHPNREADMLIGLMLRYARDKIQEGDRPLTDQEKELLFGSIT